MNDLRQAIADATGKALVTFNGYSTDRIISGITVQCNSATQTIATVHFITDAQPYIDGTSTGNGDSGGASGLELIRYTPIVIRWLLAVPGSTATAQLITETN